MCPHRQHSTATAAITGTLMMLARAVFSPANRRAWNSAKMGALCHLSTSGPPPSAPPKSPYNIDPDTADKSREEMRLHYRSNEESEFKLGKHRSNALELVEKFPIIEVEREMAICDGGGGALGHPLEYISLERPGVVERCKYCGLRYSSKKWH